MTGAGRNVRGSTGKSTTSVDSRGRSAAGSVPGSRPPSRAGSRAPSQSRAVTKTSGTDLSTSKAPVLLKNVDFGGTAYNLRSSTAIQLTQRDNAFGKAGEVVPINVNSYAVQSWPTKSVYQYDVHVGSGDEKRGLIKSIFEFKPGPGAATTVEGALGPGFIFDGNKLGWSWKEFKNEIAFTVDLNPSSLGAKQRTKKGVPIVDKHVVRIRPVSGNFKINLEVLQAWLSKRTDFSEHVLQCINFFDHLLRETPSKKLINLKRSYFARLTEAQDRCVLGGGVEALKGVYQSLRPAEGGKLIINADVTNSCSWKESTFAQLAMDLAGAPGDSGLRSMIGSPSDGKESTLFRLLKRLERSKFFVQHRGRKVDANDKKLFTAMVVSKQTAETYRFKWLNPDTDKEEKISVAAFFHKKYNVNLQFPFLPVIETAKKGEVFPMEVCCMSVGQKYNFKLSEDQTTKMLRFAVSRPGDRAANISKAIQKVDWQSDRYLKNYGMQISPNMLKTNARVLNPPEVLYRGSTAKPGFSGRWDLRGKLFFEKNPRPLKSWGVCILTGAEGGRPGAVPSRAVVDQFLKRYIEIYRGHGGDVVNTQPVVIDGIADTAMAISQTWNAAGNQARMRPQMLLVILTNRSADVYERVKKNCECRFGVVSQCVQASNVMKAAPQYCSNVLMKFNCKLGGTTHKIKSAGIENVIKKPTMIIGADVTHAAPNAPQASIACLTVSMDKTGSRYAAAVETNGYRLEMITPQNIESMLGPLVSEWMMTVGGGNLPKHVYYFRDGVSEGQYGPLLQAEVADIKKFFYEKAGKRTELVPKLTVVVCEKRHHIRFFPTAGPAADRNGNPVPGVVVDRDITHPHEQDFYINSHAAIQGTARPTHYHIIKDEENVNIDIFQKMVYEHCYQFQRASTPVSLFPAVYYAHLASLRSVSHVNQKLTTSWWTRRMQDVQAGMKAEHPEHSGLTEPPLLLPIDTTDKIHVGMWYI